MPEGPTTTFMATSTSETGTARSTIFPGTLEWRYVLPDTKGTRRLAIFPAFALSIFLSTASVLNDPRIIYPGDSSVTLGQQKPTRRRISLAEARRMALDTLWLAEHRRDQFAELEAVQFSALYEWGQ